MLSFNSALCVQSACQRPVYKALFAGCLEFLLVDSSVTVGINLRKVIDLRKASDARGGTGLRRSFAFCDCCGPNLLALVRC